MKKLISIILILSLVLSLVSCGSENDVSLNDDTTDENSSELEDNTSSNESDENSETNDDMTSSEEDESEKDMLYTAEEFKAFNEMISEYLDNSSYGLKEGSVKTGYDDQPVYYEKRSVPEIEEGQVLEVDFDNIVNKDTFTNFSEEQVCMLKENGFVVMEQNFDNGFYTFMHSFYEVPPYNGKVNLYITSDIVLHMFHIYYSETLKAYESSVYYLDLACISSKLTKGLVEKYTEAEGDMKERYKYVAAYALTGYRLLLEGADTLSDEGYNRLEEIIIKANTYRDEYNTYIENVPSEILSLSNMEYNMVEKAEADMATSRIFDYDISYTQFKPRGYYTQTDLLTRYFKSLMWYSLGGFKMEVSEDGEKLLSRNKYVEGILLAQAIVEDEEIYAAWQSIYSLSSVYSGEADDLLPVDIVNMAIAIYDSKYKNIAEGDASLLLDEKYDESIIANIEKLAQPKIIPKTMKESKYDLPTCRMIKMMGQRYSIDQYVYTSLMVPLKKAWVNSFEFFSVLGNEKAKEVLYDYYEPNLYYEDYDNLLASVTNQYKENDMWGNSLYDSWMKSIEAALNQNLTGNVPKFLTTDNYKYKCLNTALASFAELKHDNVLYTKQSFAEMGGPGPKLTMYHYVEPNIELYTNLYNSALDLKATLVDLGKDKLIDFRGLDSLIYILDNLCNISIKELKGEDLSHEDFLSLNGLGGFIDFLKKEYKCYLLQDDYYGDPEDGSALISDVSAYDDGFNIRYMELATGMPLDIFVLTKVNGQDVLCKGIVYSAYEFESDERLTDEEWKKMINMRQMYEYFQADMTEEELKANRRTPEEWKLYNVMPYTKNFMSTDLNEVIVDSGDDIIW